MEVYLVFNSFRPEGFPKKPEPRIRSFRDKKPSKVRWSIYNIAVFFLNRGERDYVLNLAQMTSIFEGQPLKTKPKLQAKQGSFGFQVYIYISMYIPGGA